MDKKLKVWLKDSIRGKRFLRFFYLLFSIENTVSELLFILSLLKLHNEEKNGDQI